MWPFSKRRCSSLRSVPLINDFTGNPIGKTTAVRCERPADGHAVHYITPNTYSPLTNTVQWRDHQAIGYEGEPVQPVPEGLDEEVEG